MPANTSLGINFDTFVERVNTVRVKYTNGKGVHQFDVNYYPGRFDDDSVKRNNEFRENREDGEGISFTDYLNETLINVIESWDIFKGDPKDGHRYEPEEIMHRLELGVKSEILAAIQRDIAPGEVKRQR